MFTKTFFHRAALCALLLSPFTGLARDPRIVMPSAAESAEWQSFLTALNQTGQSGRDREAYAKLTPLQRLLDFDKRLRNTSEAYLGFYRDHPASSMRWQAAKYFVGIRPKFITDAKPEYEKNPAPENLIVDTAAIARWEKTVTEVQSALDQAGEIPATIPQEEEHRALSAEYMGAKTKAEFLAIGERIRAHAEKYSPLPGAATLVSNFVWIATDGGAVTSAEAWALFADSPHPAVKKMADASAESLKHFRVPLDISFVAVDGRKVDLKDLRGKVVLVDFWATWCGPCVAELPNVLAVYKKYHDRGFEVVGIALENPRFTQNDTPEQKAEKLEKAKQVLTRFIATHELPWPQQFSPENFDSDLVKKFAIKAIPAMFLLDQTGMVVSTRARGPLLEAEVKRLLKL